MSKVTRRIFKLFICVFLASCSFPSQTDFSTPRQYWYHHVRVIYGKIYDLICRVHTANIGPQVKSPKDSYSTKKDLEIFIQDAHLKNISVVQFKNEKNIFSPYQFDYLSFESKKAQEFLNETKLDQLIESESAELLKFKKVLKWVHQQWFRPPGVKLTVSPETMVKYKNKSFDAMDILKLDASSRTIECSAASHLFVQAMASLGYSARLIYVGNHISTEVWSNQFKKWIMMDPYYDVLFLRESIPLNWFELHAVFEGVHDVWKGRSVKSFSDVVSFYQSFGVTVETSSSQEIPYIQPSEQNTFYFLANHIFGPLFAIHLRNDHIENVYPKYHERYHKYGKTNVLWKQSMVDYNLISTNLMWSSTRSDGMGGPVSKKFDHSYVWQATPDIHSLYWTLNLTEIYLKPVSKNPLTFKVFIKTVTPNFEAFQIQIDGDSMLERTGKIKWQLHSGQNFLKVQSKNKYGKLGPESLVEIGL